MTVGGGDNTPSRWGAFVISGRWQLSLYRREQEGRSMQKGGGGVYQLEVKQFAPYY